MAKSRKRNGIRYCRKHPSVRLQLTQAGKRRFTLRKKFSPDKLKRSWYCSTCGK